MSGVTAYSYDANENFLSLTDANANTTSYTYDSRNRTITRTDPLEKTATYQYDADGNLTQFTDRRGKVTVYHYDSLNRLTFAGYGYNGSAGYESTIGYTWDLGNRVTELDDSIAGTINLSYDGLDDLTDEQTTLGEVGYVYDNARRRESMTVVGQPAVDYTFDNSNRLTGLTQGSSSVALGYDNASRRTSLTLPNGVVAAYAYDGDSHVTGISYSLSGSPVGNLNYSYDSDGRVTGKTGSLSSIVLPSSVSGNAFDADNAMTGFNGSTLSYDANGNLTSDGTNTYTWDARNHLTAISGGTTASFVYDAFGRRVQKTVNGTSTQFLYDRSNPVQEIQGGTASANLLTGLGIDERFQRTDSAGARDYLIDILGSTLALTDSSGTIQTFYTYEPFGNTAMSGAASANPFQFTGRENDGTGSYFYRARYYNPTLSRFVSEDPIGLAGGSTDLYSYVGNSPTNRVDPSGYSWQCSLLCFAGGAAFGAACWANGVPPDWPDIGIHAACELVCDFLRDLPPNPNNQVPNGQSNPSPAFPGFPSNPPSQPLLPNPQPNPSPTA